MNSVTKRETAAEFRDSCDPPVLVRLRLAATASPENGTFQNVVSYIAS